MAIEEMFTSLPTTGSASMTDIICAVQGYSSPSTLGLSVQETLQQVYNLFSSNIIQYNAGNPNGAVAGTTYQLCWDTVDLVLWVCTTSGTASTAVWTECINPQSNWIDVVTGTVSMVANRQYICDNGASLITFTLPTTAPLGSTLYIAGKSSGGWTIVENTGQSINYGNITTTVSSGSLSSTNQNDVVHLLCTTANTTWTVINSQGAITIA